MCGCAYLNGWVAVLGIQLLALIGMLFSIATLGDCSFMELDERLFFPADMDENLPLKVTQAQYVGFLTWQKLDGSCYFYTFGSEPANQLAEFRDLLGRDWEMTRIVAMLSACLSFVYFCYLISFTCSSQVRGVRYFNAVFLSVILTALQGITFLSFESTFCEEYGCTFSRSAGFSAASMGCFFLSGLCFCCTSDYPGPRSNKKMPKLMVVAQVAPESTRGSALGTKDEVARSSYVYSEGEIEEVMPDYEDEVLDEGEEEVFDDEGEEELIDEQGEKDVIDDQGEEVLDDHGDDMVEEEILEVEDDDVTDDDDGNIESIASAEHGDDINNRNNESFVEESDMFTEVTEEEVRTVETITHTDGSQTVTETTEEVSYDNRAEV